MTKEQNKSGHLIDEATKTPRTQAAIKTYGDYIRSEDAVSIEFAEQLETELSEARAEIEKLQIETGDLIKEGCLQRHTIGEQEKKIDALDTELKAELIENLKLRGELRWYEEIEIPKKDKLIEQMREALRLADDLIDDYATDYEHRDNVDDARDKIKDALSAAERGE